MHLVVCVIWGCVVRGYNLVLLAIWKLLGHSAATIAKEWNNQHTIAFKT